MADEPDHEEPYVVQLLRLQGRGPVWGIESSDLNSTLIVWPAGHVVARHVNSERDVLLVVLDGSATVTVDDRKYLLGAADAMLVVKGAPREVVAGATGVRYLAVHQRRGPLQIGRFS